MGIIHPIFIYGAAFSLISVKVQKPYNSSLLPPFTNVETSPINGITLSRAEIKILNFET